MGDAVRVVGRGGVAWRFVRYPTRTSGSDEWTLMCDDDGHDHDQSCYVEPEPELVADEESAVVVMVGDDREEIVAVDDLEPLAREAYCGVCGQIGCSHDGLPREEEEEEEEEEAGEAPDTYRDNVDGHWYVVRYGARPQVHALDCRTCADAPEGAWVVVHEVEREYGGPEEGGWWFDTGRVVYRRRVMPDESDADQLAQAERMFDTTTSHRFSVRPRGTDYRASVGPDRGEDYPEVRPHYE